MRLYLLFFCLLSCWACQTPETSAPQPLQSDFQDLVLREKSELDSSLQALNGWAEPQKLLVFQQVPNQTPSDSTLAAIEPSITEQVALHLRVRSYPQSYRHVQELIAEYDAVLIEEREKRDSGYISNTLQVWLAPENLERFVEAIQEEALTVKERQRWRRDLKAQRIDLGVRLESKEKAKARLETLLQKAEVAQAILPIQRELDVVNEELEALRANLRYLSQRAAYSKLLLRIVEEERPSEQAEASFERRISESLDQGWVNFKESSIWLANYWPWIVLALVFGLPMLIGWRYRLSRKRRLQQQQLQLLQQQQQPLKASAKAGAD